MLLLIKKVSIIFNLVEGVVWRFLFIIYYMNATLYDYVLNQIRKFALVRSQKAEVFNWFSDPLYCSVHVRDIIIYIHVYVCKYCVV